MKGDHIVARWLTASYGKGAVPGTFLEVDNSGANRLEMERKFRCHRIYIFKDTEELTEFHMFQQSRGESVQSRSSNRIKT